MYDKANKNKQQPRGGSSAFSAASISAQGEDPIGMNVRSIVMVALLFVLLMYVAHCTYVTSNAYSHPSVVLQSHTSDGCVYFFSFTFLVFSLEIVYFKPLFFEVRIVILMAWCV